MGKNLVQFKKCSSLNCLGVYLSCLKLQGEQRNNYISFNMPLNSANKESCSVQFSYARSNYLARHVQDGSWKGSRRGWNTDVLVWSEEMTEKRGKHFNNCIVLRQTQKYTPAHVVPCFCGKKAPEDSISWRWRWRWWCSCTRPKSPHLTSHDPCHGEHLGLAWWSVVIYFHGWD